jgi:hypothetical protein
MSFALARSVSKLGIELGDRARGHRGHPMRSRYT